MRINFPNQSRSYSESHGRVQFWGYDRSMEVSFFVDAGALARLSPDTEVSEAGSLHTFDANRARIEQAAARLYSRRSQPSYTLTAGDL